MEGGGRGFGRVCVREGGRSGTAFAASVPSSVQMCCVQLRKRQSLGTNPSLTVQVGGGGGEGAQEGGAVGAVELGCCAGLGGVVGGGGGAGLFCFWIGVVGGGFGRKKGEEGGG